ncbi:MAG: acyl-CoA dehydrogenase family protein [Cyclobacteriaceae bacterium]|nr:acyl-CoA dehydrogenase family protein [Cyclobacteriaceae bacterium]
MYVETDDQRMIARMIRQLGEKEIVPHRMSWDESQEFPIPLFRKLGTQGLMGVLVPQKYGGSGFGYPEYVTVISELAQLDGSIGLSVAAHNSLCTGHILQEGSEAQKEKYLPKLASGEWIGAWGLTEPNTGSDAVNMNTIAIQDGNHYVINGSKNFITHGNSADVMVVLARTGAVRDPHGITALIVERTNPGLIKGRKENKLGMRASETTEVFFDNCQVHHSAVLGKPGEGFVQALKLLDGGRISIAALGLGIAQGALNAAVAYSKERQQFGKPISSFQGISFKLAEMATKVDAARLLIQRAAFMKQEGLATTKESAMAKYYAAEIAVEVANDAVQVFGGYGYTKDFPVEKYYRDAKLCTIGEGTTEIQKMVIGRELLKG